MYLNPDDYPGKMIRYKGIMQYYTFDTWMEATGILEDYEMDGWTYLRLRLISLVEKQERGQEHVKQ